MVDHSPPSLSPDGRFLAFAASHEGLQWLYVRDLEGGDLQQLAGTEGAQQPFWSPDGTALAFFANGSLKRVARDGGQPLTLAPAGAAPAGGDWSRDDVIVFTPEYLEGTLWRIAASGGVPAVVARPDRSAQDQSLTWPRFLPDGQAFLYVRDSGRKERDALMMRSLDRDDATAIAGIALAAAVITPGTLLYARNDWIVAQTFDPQRRMLLGDAQPVAGPVVTFDSLGAAFTAASLDRIVYQPPRAASVQLTWHARDGAVVEEIGRPEPGLHDVKLGASGTRIIGHATTEGQTDIWVWDPARGTKDRVTSTGEWENSTALSPDGRQVAFASDGRGSMDLYVRSISGSDDRALLASLPDSTLWPCDWSSDGRTIVGTGLGATTQQDVWAFAFDTQAVTWLFRTPAREGVPRLSPNGRWVAYQSDEGGQFDVYVAALVSPRDRWRVTTRGGAQPRWRADGRELFFLEPDGSVHAVTVTQQGDRLVPGPATRLFGTGLNLAESWWSRYDVSPDGRRFLVAHEVNTPPVEGFTMIAGWRPPAGER